MLPQSSTGLLAALLLSALPANADGLYTKKSPVLQLTPKTYGSLIANSNHTSIVEFYAPWCGHCQNLKPAYEKAAQNLNGLAKVAAINCDEDENKPFCGQMGVQGFPTLKIIVPSKKPGKPRVEDYQGQRSAKAIVDAVVDRIPNHVKRATDKDLDKWVAQNEDRPKAILFTEKGSTGSLIRALAIDFLGAIDVAQVRDKESTGRFAPGADAEPKIYEGELKKKPITEFLSQFAAPNPDATGEAAGDSKPKSKSKAKPTKNGKPESREDAVENQEPEVKPTQEPVAAPSIPSLETLEELNSKCLGPKTNTCVLALVADPEKANPTRSAVIPLFDIPSANTGAQSLRTQLGLGDSNPVELLAINSRRGWWRRYETANDLSIAAIEAWFDAVRLGDGAKEKLPEGIVDAPQDKETSDHDEL
ncbi:hypothetical protein N7470_008087 [Penicillium chermesinum]|nr:hypothetical protein N7470_008087 [Penicillium chermesinum]